jgi:hypothetical protein
VVNAYERAEKTIGGITYKKEEIVQNRPTSEEPSQPSTELTDKK